MAIPDDRLVEITIKVRDYEDQLVRLIDYIMHTASIGHSFDVIVDPDMSEYRKSFFMDGDGVFFIKEIKMNGKKVVIKDDKISEYLERVQNG